MSYNYNHCDVLKEKIKSLSDGFYHKWSRDITNPEHTIKYKVSTLEDVKTNEDQMVLYANEYKTNNCGLILHGKLTN